MQSILIIVHVLLTISLIGLILIQRGKGADIGASFGSGASNTVFGSQGSASFLTRTTAVLATLFFITSLSLAYFSVKQTVSQSVTDSLENSVSDMPTIGGGEDAPNIELPDSEDLPEIPQSGAGEVSVSTPQVDKPVE